MNDTLMEFMESKISKEEIKYLNENSKINSKLVIADKLLNDKTFVDYYLEMKKIFKNKKLGVTAIMLSGFFINLFILTTNGLVYISGAVTIAGIYYYVSSLDEEFTTFEKQFHVNLKKIINKRKYAMIR